MKRTVVTTMLAFLALGAAACAHSDEGHRTKDSSSAQDHAAALGKPGDPARVSRTIVVEMSDAMRFNPAQVKVKKGETIRFSVRNGGALKHEMVLGTASELQEHAALMRKFPEMEHADPNMISVESGKTGELVWQFSRAGTFDFACLQPGHFEAGMVGKIRVSR